MSQGDTALGEGGEIRPRLTFDLDGVLCRPPFGINPGKGQGKTRTKTPGPNPLWPFERWRYMGRRPMPGAVRAFRAFSKRYECIVVSARGEPAEGYTRGWLMRHFGIEPRLVLRPAPKETSAQFKARVITDLQPCVHFEDDPHTAEWLAEIIPNVVLVDWGRNRWLARENVHRVSSIAEALPIVERLCSAPASEAGTPPD